MSRAGSARSQAIVALASLALVSCSTSGRAPAAGGSDFRTISIPATSVSTGREEAGSQPLTVLATRDQSGTALDLTKVHTESPALFGYQGVFTFQVPDGVDVSGASALSLLANVYGPSMASERWQFQVRDFAASAWESVGYDDVAAPYTWQELEFPLSGDLTRFVSGDGQLQVRYQTTNGAEQSHLDFLAFEVTAHDGGAGAVEPAPEAQLTPPPAPVPGGSTATVKTVFKGYFSSTTDQLDFVASVPDLHVSSVGAFKIAALHAESPQLTTYRYVKIAGLHGPETRPPTGDPGWDRVLAADLLWRMPSGKPATQTQNGWYYIDLSSESKRAAWTDILSDAVRSYLDEGYDAVFFDNASVIESSLIDDYPSDYDARRYHDAVHAILSETRRRFPQVKIVINSYSGWAPEGLRGLGLLDQADGIFFEGFSMKTSGRFFDPDRFRQQLTDFGAAVREGKVAVAMDYGTVGDLGGRIWSLASYLLVNAPSAFHFFDGEDAGSDLQQYPEDALDIGAALSEAVERGDGLWTRGYGGATVLVNPTAAPIAYSLGRGRWQTLEVEGGGAYPNPGALTWPGLSGESITLTPNTAAIVRAGS